MSQEEFFLILERYVTGLKNKKNMREEYIEDTCKEKPVEHNINIYIRESTKFQEN